jgi:hypothetical protein
MKRLLVVGVAASALVALGMVILTGAACTAMSCCSGGAGGSAGHQHGAAATPTNGQASAAPVAFVNTKCPIMGGAIDPAKVPESLTRVYKDQKVAFCCGMCPGQWDKLTDAQKDAKLQAVAVK